MRELTKSVLSFTWAVPLFGASQVVGVLASPTKPARKAAKALDIATLAAGSQLGDMMQSMFQAGDDAQRELTDVMFSMCAPSARRSEAAARLTSDPAQWSTEVALSVAPGERGRLSWSELRNKLTVFNLVYGVPKTLNLPDQPPIPPLSELVGRAYDLGEHPALWAVEGLGHYYADLWYKRGEVPQDVLTEPDDLPAGSLTMLHAGLGMSIAQHLLKTVNHLSSRSEIRGILEQFARLCKENSKPGYAGAALESLGLITRSGAFYGETRPDEMVQIVSQELEDLDPEVFGYFWHGVGRSIYFSPINFIPGFSGLWHPLEMVRRETAGLHPEAARNAVAGLSWGVTMVNIKRPAILQNLLRYVDADNDVEREGFRNGVSSGLMMRADTTPGAPFIQELVESAVKVSSKGMSELWPELVQRPCELAINTYLPALREAGKLGEIFRFQDLATLARA